MPAAKEKAAPDTRPCPKTSVHVAYKISGDENGSIYHCFACGGYAFSVPNEIPEDTLSPTDNLDNVTREDLDEVARNLGVDPNSHPDTGKLREQIDAANKGKR